MLRADEYDFVDVIEDNQLQGEPVQYQLMAINGAGSGFSDEHEVMLPIGVPQTLPTSVEIEALGPSKLSVNWKINETGRDRGEEDVRFKMYVREISHHNAAGAVMTKRKKRRRRRSLSGWYLGGKAELG